MNKITLQEQFEFLGVETFGELIVINSEQDKMSIVESSIDTSYHKTFKSENIGNIELEGETVKRYVSLCESNGIKFILNRYLANGFTLISYTFGSVCLSFSIKLNLNLNNSKCEMKN